METVQSPEVEQVTDNSLNFDRTHSGSSRVRRKKLNGFTATIAKLFGLVTLDDTSTQACITVGTHCYG